MPLGPASILCFGRVLTRSRAVALLTILGAAVADACYGLLAAVGLTAVTRLLSIHHAALRIGGGVILLFIGCRMIRSRSEGFGREDGAAPPGLAHAFLSAFLLMIVQPMVILSFLAVFAAIDVTSGPMGTLPAALLGAGVLIGSSAWWIVYQLAAALFGKQLRASGPRPINVTAGCLMCAFGVWQLIDLALGR